MLRDDAILLTSVGLVEQVVQVRARVVAGVAVVEAHVGKVRLDVGVEEALHLVEVEVRVDEDCSHVCFDDIGETFWRIGDCGPVVHHVWCCVLGLAQLSDVLANL